MGINIPVRCTFEKYDGRFMLQIFRGSAAGASHRNICSQNAPR